MVISIQNVSKRISKEISKSTFFPLQNILLGFDRFQAQNGKNDEEKKFLVEIDLERFKRYFKTVT